MREQFINKRFRQSSLNLIQASLRITNAYSDAGYSMSLRQLYYRLVATDVIPNTVRSYKNLGNLISNARLAGLMDWDIIEDRTRGRRGQSHWNSPKSMMETAANLYHIDKWQNQDCRIEVWVEKEALIGVLERACYKYDVDYFACKGYVSQSEQWAAGKRLHRYNRENQRVVVIHLGDHDPSGLDMTRDNDDRLSMFSYYGNIEIKRIALNWDQIEQYDPPPDPAKITDTRFANYCSEFGEESWELDALEPDVIVKLIEDQIIEYRDPDKWKVMIKKEVEEKELLKRINKNWVKVNGYLDSKNL